MLEEAYALMYCMDGSITWADLQEMTPQDREWMLLRVRKQQKREAELQSKK